MFWSCAGQGGRLCNWVSGAWTQIALSSVSFGNTLYVLHPFYIPSVGSLHPMISYVLFLLPLFPIGQRPGLAVLQCHCRCPCRCLGNFSLALSPSVSSSTSAVASLPGQKRSYSRHGRHVLQNANGL